MLPASQCEARKHIKYAVPTERPVTFTSASDAIDCHVRTMPSDESHASKAAYKQRKSTETVT